MIGCSYKRYLDREHKNYLRDLNHFTRLQTQYISYICPPQFILILLCHLLLFFPSFIFFPLLVGFNPLDFYILGVEVEVCTPPPTEICTSWSRQSYMVDMKANFGHLLHLCTSIMHPYYASSYILFGCLYRIFTYSVVLIIFNENVVIFHLMSCKRFILFLAYKLRALAHCFDFVSLQVVYFIFKNNCKTWLDTSTQNLFSLKSMLPFTQLLLVQIPVQLQINNITR